jgi:hypothetical protein
MVLYHFSEDPAIRRFEPRPPPTDLQAPPLVWAISPTHAPHYYFPRDCPRVIIWARADSDPADVARLLGTTAAQRVIAIESAWLERVRATRLFIYHLPAATFTLRDEPAGYFVSPEAVEPLQVEPAGDLLARLVAAGVELRITPSLWPLRHAVVQSTLDFSIIRMRNAQPEKPSA